MKEDYLEGYGPIVMVQNKTTHGKIPTGKGESSVTDNVLPYQKVPGPL